MMDFEANLQDEVLEARPFLGDLKVICSRLQVAPDYAIGRLATWVQLTHPIVHIVFCSQVPFMSNLPPLKLTWHICNNCLMVGKGETSRIPTYKILVFRGGYSKRYTLWWYWVPLAAWSVIRNDRSNPKERLQLKEVMAGKYPKSWASKYLPREVRCHEGGAPQKPYLRVKENSNFTPENRPNLPPKFEEFIFQLPTIDRQITTISAT